MKNKRRDFLKTSGLISLGLAGSGFTDISQSLGTNNNQAGQPLPSGDSAGSDGGVSTMIGIYGPWAASLSQDSMPSFSFRNENQKDLQAWRPEARQKVRSRMAIPDLGPTPSFRVISEFNYDGLLIRELQWQLPYGRPTTGILLKPSGAKNPLPGILAFHDHGGDKYFGCRKITRTSDQQHPMMVAHQKEYYSGFAWANEIAKRGYVVLVPDAFAFASRRVMLQDLPTSLSRGLTDNDPENPDHIFAYNQWASQHEHIMAKSLFCAGTTWPGVFFAEDRQALNILCALEGVDAGRIGCAGLSGGGLRTVFMGGLDPRIQCAITVGFMSTWKDFLLNKSENHTWMAYVPLLPNELDFPEILGIRAPLPTLVLNDIDDDLYTMPEMQAADRTLRAVYQKAGAPDRYKCNYYPGPHKFDAAMQKDAFNWFDQWLKS